MELPHMRGRKTTPPSDSSGIGQLSSSNSSPATLPAMSQPAPYNTWMCLICGFVYDEALGAPEDGIPPGTRWEDVPPNWTCPDCGARKDDFEMIALEA